MQIEPKKEYSVVLTGEEIGLVQTALIKLPYEYVAGLVQELPNKIKEINSNDDEPITNMP